MSEKLTAEEALPENTEHVSQAPLRSPVAILVGATMSPTATQEASNSLSTPIEETTTVPFAPPQPVKSAPTNQLHTVDNRSLVAELVEQDDLALAYWASRALVEQQKTTLFAPELLASAFMARHIGVEHGGASPLINDLLNVALTYEPETAEAEVLAFAAAIRPTLLIPTLDLEMWLEVPSVCRPLGNIAEPLIEWAKSHCVFSPGLLAHVQGSNEQSRTIQQLGEQARHWLQDAQDIRFSYTPALAVWRKLAHPSGPLHQLMTKVDTNASEDLPEVQRLVAMWNTQEARQANIDEIDRIIRKPAVGKPIEYKALENLHHRISTACDYAERWCHATLAGHRMTSDSDWVIRQHQLLQERISAGLPEAWRAVEELTQAASRSLAASASYLLRSLADLTVVLQISIPSGGVAPSWEVANPQETSTDLLAVRLWRLPELEFNEQLLPTAEALANLTGYISQPEIRQRDAMQAVRLWIGRENFQMVAKLRGHSSEEIVDDTLDQTISDARLSAVARLRRHIDQTISAIELAYGETTINEVDRVKYVAQLNQLRDQHIDNYLSAYMQIATVADAIKRARQERMQQLERYATELLLDLTKLSFSDHHVTHVRETVKDAVERNDPRLLDETLDRVRRVLHGEEQLDDWSPVIETDEIVQQQQRYFTQRAELVQLARAGIPQAKAQLHQGALIQSLTSDSPPCDIDGALQSWLDLKKLPGRHNQAALRIMIEFLGFGAATVSDIPPTTPTVRRSWSYARIEINRPAGLQPRREITPLVKSRPIAELGSRASQYHIVCVDASSESIASILQRIQLESQILFLFYFGTLSNTQLSSLRSLTRSDGRPLTVIALDEPLLLFLGHEIDRDRRFRILLHCTLAYTKINPFMPYCHGRVPTEMFYGREELITELQTLGGRCILYGGRQYGKTALLNETARRFNLIPEQHAHVEDILNLGASPDQPTTSIWARLRNILRDHLKLLNSQVKTDRADEMMSHIRKVLNQDDRRRVLIMFDEADAFLSADERDGFRVVSELRRLVMNTEGRFKVIFSGLRSVQRFANHPNHPLVQFGAPICIGQLTPHIARELIEQPLHALGYTFTDASSVGRILSYTNYHVGLLQIYGDELVKRLNNRQRRGDPPYAIEAVDVDQTYLEIRDEIADRFRLTLRLNDYYRAIALMLIYEQQEKRQYTVAYTASDVRRLGNEYWPAGFRAIHDEEIRALLDEMCGLGLLVRDAQGTYRLRSANIVRLMGNEDELLNALATLADQVPPNAADIDHYQRAFGNYHVYGIMSVLGIRKRKKVSQWAISQI